MSPTHDFKDIGDVLNFQLLKGIIATIDSATDTCTVTVGGDIVTALLYYHCTPASELRDNGAISGAAKGFKVGDEVIVLINKDKTSIKVIGHTDGIRRCTESAGAYYIFYIDGTTLKIAQCTWDAGIVVVDTKTGTQVFSTNNNFTPVTINLKRFTHNVPTGGVTITRDLYLVVTSLYLNPAPFYGWTNFAAANPAFPLVTNNVNTKITMTSQVMADLNTVNYNVNHTHAYVPEPAGSDNWKIMGEGESGDCEDFALTKAQALLDLGYPASAIHFEAGVNPAGGRGHGWLVVQTTSGDYALDVNSDAIGLNAGLSGPWPGGELLGRRRQIGNNWAFISAYGWLLNSSTIDPDESSGPFWYILDPLLNIFHPILPADFCRGLVPLCPSSRSVNFSADNNRIYIASTGSSGGIIKGYKLNENVLSLISETAYETSRTWDLYIIGMGNVGRNGSIIPCPPSYFLYDDYPSNPEKICGYTIDYCWEMSSPNGYYDTQYINPPYTGLPGWQQGGGQLFDYLNLILGKTLGNPFISYLGPPPPPGGSTPHLHTPFGEDFVNGVGAYWAQIDTDTLLIQAFVINSGGTLYRRMYKNSVSCLSDVIAAAGTTETNLLGLVYIPNTNRLN